MPVIKYPISLTREQKNFLYKISKDLRIDSRERIRAKILLRADEGFTDAVVALSLSIGTATVWRVRKRFVEHGLDFALKERPKFGNRKLDRKQEQRVLTLIKQPPPGNRQRWTLRLLASHISELGWVDSVSHETIRTILSKNEQTLELSQSCSEISMS